MTLIEWAVRNQLDYEKIKARCIFKVQPAQTRGEVVDISVIIPVRGRTEFHKIVTEYFLQAIDNYKGKVAITFVEHDDMPPKHYWLTKRGVNHIFIPSDGHTFNKCLCHNMGVLYGPKAHNYLFHDIDILVPDQFFNMLMQNMGGKDAVQSFTQRRLILATESVTGQLISGERKAEFYSRNNHDYQEALPGAPGGSICVKKDYLLKVGFWEDCFFVGYSVEDQFFFNKLKLMGNMGFCDGPVIELVHLWHPSHHQLTTRPDDMVALDTFDLLPISDKKEYIHHRKEYFLKYFQ